MKTLAYNIKYLRKLRRLSTEDLARKIGVGKSSIGNYEAGVSSPDHIKLLGLADALGVSLDLLLKGDLLNNDLQVLQDQEKESGIVKEQGIVYEARKLSKSKLKDKLHLDRKPIPVFKDSAAASVIQMYDDISEADGAMVVPGYDDCDFATYAFGDSMYPIIHSGNLILCKRINNKQLIMWGEIYFFRTPDYRLIKRLQRSERKGYIVAVSENDEKRRDGDRKYEPLEIKMDEIQDLYLIKGIIKKIQN